MGGHNVYTYAPNPVRWIDPLRLNNNCPPAQRTHTETYANKPVKPEDATNKWDEFLGEGPHTNIHPITGQVDPDRILSADGKRSIRYGNHEINSKPTKNHYHEETWTLSG